MGTSFLPIRQIPPSVCLLVPPLTRQHLVLHPSSSLPLLLSLFFSPFSSLPLLLSLFVSAEDNLPREPDGKTSAPWKVVCGACAGVVAQTITYPGDTVRRRMQTNGMGGAAKHYAGTIDCIKQIVVKEGRAGVFAGYGANLMKSLPGAGIQVCVRGCAWVVLCVCVCDVCDVCVTCVLYMLCALCALCALYALCAMCARCCMLENRW